MSWWAGAIAVVALGCGPGEAGAGADRAQTASGSELTSSEGEALLFMREEEKLARDVYLALGRRWGTPVFSNIASSEQRHMDSVGTLLTRYQLADPAAGRAEGEFANAQLQNLFTQLMAKGATSPTEALIVGATIEDLDIADLTRLSGETARADILSVYANLTRGSRNHLRAFVGQLASQGASYSPQYLDLGTFDGIVSSPTERGGR